MKLVSHRHVHIKDELRVEFISLVYKLDLASPDTTLEALRSEHEISTIDLKSVILVHLLYRKPRRDAYFFISKRIYLPL